VIDDTPTDDEPPRIRPELALGSGTADSRNLRRLARLDPIMDITNITLWVVAVVGIMAAG
jgi:hypothetical protein